MESNCAKPSSGSHWQVTQALGASDVTATLFPEIIPIRGIIRDALSGSPSGMLQGHGSSPPVPSVVRLSMKREEEVVVRSASKGLKELSGEDE